MATPKLPEISRSVLLLGKTGAGKSSVANNILTADNTFAVADTTKSVARTAQMSKAAIRYQGQEYNVKVCETIGLLDSQLSDKAVMKGIETFFKSKLPEGVNLILFVFQVGRLTSEERNTFKYIMENFQGRDISDISALVFTHCEDKNATARDRIVTEFTTHKDTKDIADFMKKGIVCVGFPRLEYVDEVFQDVYKKKAKKDTERLHELIAKSSDMRLREIFFDRDLAQIRRNVVVLGKTGAGKSRVANNILCSNDFLVSNSALSVTGTAQESRVMTRCRGRGVDYYVKVVDTIGLFHSQLSNKEVMKDTETFLKSKVPEGVNLILFVMQCGRVTPEERENFKYIMENFQGRNISDISALVITNCEDKSATTRDRIVTKFTTDENTKDIAAFMKKGIFCVGFPSLDDIDEDLQDIYQKNAEKDTDRLHELIAMSSETRLGEEVAKCTIL